MLSLSPQTEEEQQQPEKEQPQAAEEELTPKRDPGDSRELTRRQPQQPPTIQVPQKKQHLHE